MEDSQEHLPERGLGFKMHVQDGKHYYKSQWLCLFLSKVRTGVEMEGTSWRSRAVGSRDAGRVRGSELDADHDDVGGACAFNNSVDLILTHTQLPWLPSS